MRGWFRWVVLLVVLSWVLPQNVSDNLWEYFVLFMIINVLFGSDIRRLFENISNRLNQSNEKRQHYVYQGVGAQSFDNEDGLNRRIIRASDGEILVAVEDPQTGMLYLEDQV